MSSTLQRMTLILLALALALALLGALDPSPPEQTLRLQHARLIPAPGVADGVAVVLPHRWSSGREDRAVAWYQFHFDLPAIPERPLAIYLPAVGENAALYLNGEFIGQAAPFGEGVPRMHAKPLLFPVDPPLWQAEGNTLFIAVEATPWQRGLLPTPWIDEEFVLAGVHRSQQFLRQSLVRFLGVASLVLGLVLALVWANRRSEPDYGWLALAAMTWSVAQAQATITMAPLPGAAWDALTAGALGVSAVATLGFVLRFIARPPRRAYHLAWALPVLMSLATVFYPGSTVEAFSWLLLSVLLLTVAAILAHSGWIAALPAHRLLLLPGVLLGSVAAHAFAAERVAAGATAALLVALPLVIIALSWKMLQRFIESLQVAELLNIDLDRLVHERTVALETQFHRIRALEREQAIATERERLMRDMHDGLGGHLVSTLAMLECSGRRDDAIAGSIRNALDDLRLLIDSLDPVDGDLGAVLAMFRDRMEPRLQAAGLRLEWDVRELPELSYLSPASVLSILRILQECVANVLKHAAAKTIRISARPDPGAEEIILDISDDGRGFDPAAARNGRGLHNLQRRANALAALLVIESGDAGSRMTLRLPAVNATTVASAATDMAGLDGTQVGRPEPVPGLRQ